MGILGLMTELHSFSLRAHSHLGWGKHPHIFYNLRREEKREVRPTVEQRSQSSSVLLTRNTDHKVSRELQGLLSPTDSSFTSESCKSLLLRSRCLSAEDRELKTEDRTSELLSDSPHPLNLCKIRSSLIAPQWGNSHILKDPQKTNLILKIHTQTFYCQDLPEDLQRGVRAPESTREMFNSQILQVIVTYVQISEPRGLTAEDWGQSLTAVIWEETASQPEATGKKNKKKPHCVYILF